MACMLLEFGRKINKLYCNIRVPLTSCDWIIQRETLLHGSVYWSVVHHKGTTWGHMGVMVSQIIGNSPVLFFNCWFRLTSKKTSKPSEWNQQVTGGLPSQKACNMESILPWQKISHLTYRAQYKGFTCLTQNFAIFGNDCILTRSLC